MKIKKLKPEKIIWCRARLTPNYSHRKYGKSTRCTRRAVFDVAGTPACGHHAKGMVVEQLLKPKPRKGRR